MIAEISNDVPRVILVTPHYGQVSMGLRQTLNGAVRDKSLLQVVMEAQCSSSVLPHCFNQLLSIALAARDQDRVTHLAMAHSDIVAEPGWLDTLWGEMRTNKLDLISCVVPIKAPSGRTSTAIGDEADRWKINRHLYLADRTGMPETFEPRHVCGQGEVLLVNTGLFLADLRCPWWEDFAFQFHTRLRKLGNTYTAECRSEDWELSHHLHEHGAPYAATWKVKLRHDGHTMYQNREDA